MSETQTKTGLVYLLKDKTEKCYVGQTTDMYNRIKSHTDNIKNKNMSCSSKELNIDFICETLEDNITTDLLDLREQYWYDFYREKCGKLLVNINRPLNDKKKYHEDYYEDHKDSIKERQKQYREDHKDELKDKAKQYYKDHKEKIKQYREDHKDRLIEKINCECGGKYTRASKCVHFKTKKHIDYDMKQKQ